MGRKKILVVDDEESIREMVRVILGEELYEFAEAGDGLTAQVHIKAHPVDLVITDIIMPDCDGIELVLALRSQRPDLKVIVLSGGGRMKAGHYLNVARKLGATQVFEKPVDTEELRMAVKNCLKNRN